MLSISISKVVFTTQLKRRFKSSPVYIIAAVCNNNLVWHIPEDIAYFRKKTSNHIVVMGSNTYFSIPKSQRPLKSRLNIVVTSNSHHYNLDKDNDKTIFCKPQNIMEILKDSEKHGYTKCFFIGGQSIYEDYLDKVNCLYLTKIYKDFECDKFFPSEYKNLFVLHKSSPLFHSEKEDCDFKFEKYISLNV